MKKIHFSRKAFWRTLLIVLLCSGLLFVIVRVCSPPRTDNDSIVADFDKFVNLLEKSHPDPYTNYGGKPLFHEAAEKTRLGLIRDKVSSLDEFVLRINEFIAPLQDGHTAIYFPGDSLFKSHPPITFEVINDGIIVKRIAREHEDLIGSRVISIEKMPIMDLCDSLAKIWPAENRIGRMQFLNGLGSTAEMLSKVVPNMNEKEATYQLLTPDGKQVEVTLPFLSDEEKRDSTLTETRHTDIIPSKDLTFDFVDNDKNTMYLRLTQINARDNFEAMKDMGMDIKGWLEWTYTNRGEEMPQDVDEAVAKLPSFSEEFEKMLMKMKENGSKNLIIDLRNNQGGFTPTAWLTLYQMYGDEFIKKAVNDFGTENYTLYSRLYHNKMNNIKPLWYVNWKNGTDLKYGEYIISEHANLSEITDSIRDIVIDNGMSCIKDRLKALHGKPVYTPEHVYVLTDPETFSAGFHYAFYLWKMGATLVGVPCKQAPNTYMEMTPFMLPRTKLSGSISNTLQMFLPADDPRAKELTPDLMPTYEDYKRYNFDDNTIPLYLMDIIKGKK